MLVIREAVSEDIETLALLGHATFNETYAAENTQSDMELYLAQKFNIGQVSKEFNAPGSHFFIAEYQGTAVGYIKYSTNNSPEGLSGNPLELEHIYVLKEYHGRGIGKKLTENCISYALEKYHTVIWLIVWEKNLAAQKFYAGLGFKIFGKKEFVLGNDVQNDYMMKLQLSDVSGHSS